MVKRGAKSQLLFLEKFSPYFFGNLFESSLFFVIAAPNKFIFNSSNF